jgi:hypothetical protein
MICGNYVKFVTRRKKGSGEEYQAARDLRLFTHFQHEHDKMLAEGWVICDGQVQCTEVRAVDEPDWGHSYAVLQVKFKCNKCGNTSYPELGDDGSTIAKLVTQALDAMSVKEREKLRNDWWQDQLDRNARIEKLALLITRERSNLQKSLRQG